MGFMLGCALALSLMAQLHRNAHKLRATAVLEIITDASGKKLTRLTPVTILANGRFQDASIYESRPQPMALSGGVVYEAQKSGVPVGYLTITTTQESNGIWVAGGNWQLPAKPKPPAPPAAVSSGAAQSDGDRPVLHRRESGSSQAPSANPSEPPSPSGAGSQPDDDRPIIRRPASTQPDASTSAPAAPSPGANTPAQTAQPEQDQDPNRPTLRRHGTTAHQQQEQETRPLPSPSVQRAVDSVAAQPSGLEVQTLVAVSDAQPSETRSYEFTWKPGEQSEMEAKIEKLALEQFPRETPALTLSSFKNVVLRSFDLDMSNDAVMVLTAELPAPTKVPARTTRRKAAPAPSASPAKPVTRYIGLIARIDIDGNPAKLMTNITDSAHLDVVPRLELIDAVDVDGAGPAELLFREYGYNERGYVIYGVSHGTATKIFEGATQPLKLAETISTLRKREISICGADIRPAANSFQGRDQAGAGLLQSRDSILPTNPGKIV